MVSSDTHGIKLVGAVGLSCFILMQKMYRIYIEDSYWLPTMERAKLSNKLEVLTNTFSRHNLQIKAALDKAFGCLQLVNIQCLVLIYSYLSIFLHLYSCLHLFLFLLFKCIKSISCQEHL